MVDDTYKYLELVFKSYWLIFNKMCSKEDKSFKRAIFRLQQNIWISKLKYTCIWIFSFSK